MRQGYVFRQAAFWVLMHASSVVITCKYANATNALALSKRRYSIVNPAKRFVKRDRQQIDFGLITYLQQKHMHTHGLLVCFDTLSL